MNKRNPELNFRFSRGTSLKDVYAEKDENDKFTGNVVDQNNNIISSISFDDLEYIVDAVDINEDSIAYVVTINNPNINDDTNL